MNLIIPMAGKGKRLRPHTLTTPKPLIPIAGKPIVQRLVEDISKVTPEKIEKIAKAVGAEGYIFEQEVALGTAHAVHCAREILTGKCIVAFADTLFKASFTLNTNDDGIIWVKQVADPSAYGVVNVNEAGVISEFVEKPEKPVSDLAIIGIYYFKDGDALRAQLDHIIDHNIMAGGEYQLTTALENLKQSGTKFTPGEVNDWLDCGNKKVTVASNTRYLQFIGENQIAESAIIKNAIIVPPVTIGENVTVENSVIGPHVSVGDGSVIFSSRIEDSLIQTNVNLRGVNITNSMIGNYVDMESLAKEVSLGDYTQLKG
jgi:glucose-1-phosphate thymidylyltransferase